MIPHTVAHYRSRFPGCQITVYDNDSTDRSVELAISLGCNVIRLDTQGILNEFSLTELRNSGWKVANDWVIVCDMDEWLCFDESKLKAEEENGTTILRVIGYNIIADSNSEKLEDLDLQNLTMGVFNPYECKNICFNAKYIRDINFSLGAHECSPVGQVKFSENEYILKHMDELGVPYKCYKNTLRFERSEKMRTQHGMCNHYVRDDNILRDTLQRLLNNSYDISHILK
jgi:glycosyltransferase involved in cell wall biosynthesis